MKEAGRGEMRRQRRSATQEILRRETKGWSGGGEGAPRRRDPAEEGEGAGYAKAGARERRDGDRGRKGGGRKVGRFGDTEEAGRGRAADGGGAAGVRTACLGPGGPGDSKIKPRCGSGEKWV